MQKLLFASLLLLTISCKNKNKSAATLKVEKANIGCVSQELITIRGDTKNSFIVRDKDRTTLENIFYNDGEAAIYRGNVRVKRGVWSCKTDSILAKFNNDSTSNDTTYYVKMFAIPLTK